MLRSNIGLYRGERSFDSPSCPNTIARNSGTSSGADPNVIVPARAEPAHNLPDKSTKPTERQHRQTFLRGSADTAGALAISVGIRQRRRMKWITSLEPRPEEIPRFRLGRRGIDGGPFNRRKLRSFFEAPVRRTPSPRSCESGCASSYVLEQPPANHFADFALVCLAGRTFATRRTTLGSPPLLV